MTNIDKSVNVKLTDAQVSFLELCKEVKWGKIEVIVKQGEPALSRVLEWTHQHK